MERCKKPVGHGEYEFTHLLGAQHIICNDCATKLRKLDAEIAYKDYCKQTKRGYFWGGIVGAIILVAMLALATVGYINGMPAAFVFISAIIVGFAGFAFTSQMIWDNAINDMFFACFHSFKMPGIIFEFDLDGIIATIALKIGLALLSAALSVVVFIIGFFITYIGSILIFPFAALVRFCQAKRLRPKD